MGTTQRHRDGGTALRNGVHPSQREGRSTASLCRPGIGPGSRPAFEVPAMSQENVEIVRRGFEVWNVGDMGAFREVYDPDVIWRGPQGWPEPGPYAGREAVIAREQLRETWDSDSFELISDFIDVGDRVAVRFIWRVRATALSRILRRRPFTRCARAGSSPSSSSGITWRPLEPWGSRTRRCRRRTWRWCVRPVRPCRPHEKRRPEAGVFRSASDAGGRTRTCDTRIMIPLL